MTNNREILTRDPEYMWAHLTGHIRAMQTALNLLAKKHFDKDDIHMLTLGPLSGEGVDESSPEWQYVLRGYTNTGTAILSDLVGERGDDLIGHS